MVPTRSGATEPRGHYGGTLHGGTADEAHGIGRRTGVARLCAPRLRMQGLPCPLDRVNRQFKADRPNQLWVSDFTYVSTWQGWLYVAFVIDVFARRIVGWRVSSSACTRTSCWMRWSRPYTPGNLSWVPCSPQRQGLPVRLHPLYRAACRGWHKTVGGQPGRQLRQRTGRDHQRAVQGRIDSPPGPGKPGNLWNWPRWNGWHWFNHQRLLDPSAISRPQKLRQTTTGNSPALSMAVATVLTGITRSIWTCG
jgi:putative transposase